MAGGTQLTFKMPEFLSHEAIAADAVKRNMPVTVVIGNPPYAYESVNTGKFIRSIVRSYYEVDGQPLNERNPRGLQDDYVKFFRFGEWLVDRTGTGILAFITNHGYIDSPTFRG